MELLVVDDEPQLSELMAEYLARCGYNATCAGNTREALQLLAERRFPVVISDITMPGQSGLELLEAAREISPETRVILITGSPSARAASEALEQGAFALFHKPFSLLELRKKIDEAAREHLPQPKEASPRGPKPVHETEQEKPPPLRSVELQILASMGTALALVDPKGTVLYASEGFLKTFSGLGRPITGSPLCKAMGCALASGTQCSNPCEIWDRLQKASKEGRSSGPFVCSLPLNGETPRKRSLFHSRILVVPQDNGISPENQQLAVLLEDVSEVLDAEAQVLDSGCLGCLGEITRDIVHELAQPLNAISAQCQLLKFRIEQQGESSKEVVLSGLEELQRQTHRMTELLNHLRSGYRARAWERQAEPSPPRNCIASAEE